MKVLFVCSGNTCRSPMAMAIWRALGGEARSAGLHAVPGAGLASDTRLVLEEAGIPVPEHTARELHPRDVLWADWVLAMTEAQREEVVARFPWARPWVRTVAEAGGGEEDVADPVGRGVEAYRATRSLLLGYLRRAYEELRPRPPWDVAVGNDHAGLGLKAPLLEELTENGRSVLDVGTDSHTSCDYPDFARLVAWAVAFGKSSFGLLICGTGQGMAIAANKVAGVRAAVVSEPVSARLARAHNDANVLCLGARIVGEELARESLRAFLEAGFAGGRHARRVEKIRHLEAAEAREAGEEA